MLNFVAQLAQNGIRQIGGILRHEINTDSLGTDQPDYEFDFFLQHIRNILEKDMRSIKKEDNLWFFKVTDFRQLLIQLRKKP